MGKKKTPAFSKMVCEALTTADEEKGMNSKMILAFIKEKYSINGDDKTNLNFIHQELGRGKTSKEYLQVKGDSVHGFFTFNIFYVPPSEHQPDELPDYLNPPEAPKEPVGVPLQEPKKRRKKKKNQTTAVQLDESPQPKDPKSVLLRISTNGRVEKGELDEFGNMKFSVFKKLPYLSRAQRHQINSKNPKPMTHEEAEKMASDPVFRRVFAQTETVKIDPELQNSLDGYSVRKSKNTLKGDRTDRLRLGNKSHFGDVLNNQTDNEEEDKKNTTENNLNSNNKTIQLKVEKRKPLHPKVVKILKKGIVYTHIENMKSLRTKSKAKGLANLHETLHEEGHQKVAVVKAGTIPCIVDCIDSSDFECSNMAITNLLLLCVKFSSDKEIDICEEILKSNIIKRLFDLTESDYFESDSIGLVKMPVVFLTHYFSRYLLRADWMIRKEQFNDLMRLLLKLIEFIEVEKIFKDFLVNFNLLLHSYFLKDREYVWQLKFTDEKVQFLFSKFDNNDEYLRNTLLLLFRMFLVMDGEHFVPFLTNLGFIDTLLECLECEKLAESSLDCFRHIVDDCFKGYEYVYKDDFISKIVPFINSNDNECRRSATQVLASLIDAKFDLMTPYLDLVSFFKLCNNIKEFNVSHESLTGNLHKLSEQIKNQSKGDLKKIVRRMRRANKH